MEPRTPTPAELSQISAHFRAQPHFSDQSEEEFNNYLLECCCVAVFDGYITDGPGYAGRVVSIVWSGSPNIVTVLTFRVDGGIDECGGELGGDGG